MTQVEDGPRAAGGAVLYCDVDRRGVSGAAFSVGEKNVLWIFDVLHKVKRKVVERKE